MTSYLFHGGRLLDPRRDTLVENAHVLVEDDRIKEVSDRPIGAASATRVDLRGRTLMPGLIDAHIHILLREVNIHFLDGVPLTLLAAKGSASARAMLMRGFTSVRDTGGADYGMKAAIESGLFEGPRVFISGMPISQTGGHGDFRKRTQTGLRVHLLLGPRPRRARRRRRSRDAARGARRAAQGRRPDQDHGLGRRRLASRSAREPAIPDGRDRGRGRGSDALGHLRLRACLRRRGDPARRHRRRAHDRARQPDRRADREADGGEKSVSRADARRLRRAASGAAPSTGCRRTACRRTRSC